MIASSLRIGNLIGKVTDESLDTVVVTTDILKKIQSGEHDFIEIPLSDYWLDVLGFKFNESFLWWYKYTGFTDVCIDVRKDVSYSSNYSYDWYPITSVHQLQNLYHSLTGKEL